MEYTSINIQGNIVSSEILDKVRSEDIFALSSWREMLYLMIPRVLPFVVVLCFILFSTSYWKKVLVSTAMYGILAISWDFLASAGLVSLGQALFFGLGAYIALDDK